MLGSWLHILRYFPWIQQRTMQMSSRIKPALLTAASSISAFVGVLSYLTLVERLGGVGTSFVALIRKILTLFLSFMFFPKPFSLKLMVYACLIFLPIILRIKIKYSKRIDKNNKVGPPCHGNETA